MTGKTVKTINNILTRKVDKWLETIDNADLRAACKKDVIVTGGSIASMLLGEEVNDYDIYFKRYSTTVAVANYYLDKFQEGRTVSGYSMKVEELKDTVGRDRVRIVVQSEGIAGELPDEPELAEGAVVEEAREEKPEYYPVFLSSNAITLKGGVQLILRFHGDHEAIHENFDFVHCMNYWTRKDGVVVNNDSLLSLMSKTLVYRGSLYPVCSIFRSKKFIQRGWKINAGQYLKMAMQISELNLNDPVILEEQLTGVDVAYFQQVIHQCRKDNQDVIDTAYLMEVVNRMFG